MSLNTTQDHGRIYLFRYKSTEEKKKQPIHGISDTTFQYETCKENAVKSINQSAINPINKSENKNIYMNHMFIIHSFVIYSQVCTSGVLNKRKIKKVKKKKNKTSRLKRICFHLWLVSFKKANHILHQNCISQCGAICIWCAVYDTGQHLHFQ